MSERKQCGHETLDGGACRADFGLCPKCGWCFHHCPHRERERKEARHRGAQATAKAHRQAKAALDDGELPPLTSHEAAEAWTDAIGRAAATGRMNASSANAALRAVREWREAREDGKTSERLEGLLDALSEWKKTGDPGPVLELVQGGGS